VVLALIPVIGFFANGITYVGGKGEVGQSFATDYRARELADASRDFKIAFAAMSIAAKDFTVSPHGALIYSFAAAAGATDKSLDRIESSIGNLPHDDIGRAQE